MEGIGFMLFYGFCLFMIILLAVRIAMRDILAEFREELIKDLDSRKKENL
ncbi:hypothetical protein SDC9_81732 [bioreactor metagenome]|uniref:Uncharacterized protein n=1 Tax=bioreactor metagenome TaxID=1076179 RepID=A0A644Z2Y2_9ZZZZ